MDQYCVLVLIWLYSPILSSLRGLQQASKLEKVQKIFGVPRTSLGSLSESVQVFDPEPLNRIAQKLEDQLPSVLSRPRSKGFDPATIDRFSIRGKTITAVDGSIVKTLARVAGLSWIKVGNDNPACGYRFHAQFEILRGIPNRIDATSANPRGPADERVV